MTEDNQNKFPSLWSTQLIFFHLSWQFSHFVVENFKWYLTFILHYSVFSVNFGRMWFIFPMTAYNVMYYFTLLINSALFDEENILINTCNWEIREVIWNNCQLNRDTAIALFMQSFWIQHIGYSQNVPHYHKSIKQRIYLFHHFDSKILENREMSHIIIRNDIFCCSS